MSKMLTLAQIKRAHPCNRDPKIFEAVFGDSVEVTFEGITKVALAFDWNFASRHLLTPKQQKHYREILLPQFRQIDRLTENRDERRRRAMAVAFYRAYNSPTE